MDQNKIDIECLLKQGELIRIKPQGYSMYPMFIPGRDEAILKSAEPAQLKRGDVVLYRRDAGILVLHRICKVKKNTFYMVGDNQREVEGPLREDQIRGVLTDFIRNGRYISVNNPIYIIASRLWLFLRPIRPVISKSVAALKRLFKKQMGEKT